jgi:beta-alanine--pyruvate transaminase
VIDIRNCGLMGAVEFAPKQGVAVGTRGMDIMVRMWNKGVMARVTGDTIAMSPPLILNKSHIDTLVGTLSDAIKEHAAGK